MALKHLKHKTKSSRGVSPRPSKLMGKPSKPIELAKTEAPMRYPKPSPTGGRLVRQVIALLREHGVKLPIASHILIATSAGADSIALAHLLTHYGRRVGDRSRISLLHINHGWRAKESDTDEEFVIEAGRRWKVPVQVFRLEPPKARAGQGWEDLARTARKKIFAREAAKKDAVILTAHHADDLAETVLWRILTGSHETHGGGIAVKHGSELRPLLRIRKEELKQYLKEEGESWREDVTNADVRFLRARLRMEVMPALERVFPRAIERLSELGLDAQLRVQSASGEPSQAGIEPALHQGLEMMLSAAGLRLRRSHWEQLERLSRDAPHDREAHLPEGWRLRHDRSRDSWVLEKIVANQKKNVGNRSGRRLPSARKLKM